MSIIDTENHNIVPYVSGTTKAFTGQRLASFNWKTVTDKSSVYYGIKRESKAVSLPMITAEAITDNLIVLMPHIVSMLHSVQDKIIKAKLEIGGDSVVSIGNELINMKAIVEYLGDSNESGRLTKESVAAWFDESISNSLSVVLADKLGISEVPTNAESDKILAIVGKFRADISALAGGKTSYTPKVAAQLLKAVNHASDEDVIASKFKARLQKMIDVDVIKENDLLNSL